MKIEDAPQSLRNSIAAYCSLIDYRCIIAGGFVRAYYAGETPADMDVYFQKQEDCDDFEKIMSESEDWEETFRTDRAISFTSGRKRVQLISVIFGEPSVIIDAFDYTVCAIASCGSLVFMHDDFFRDLAGRVLVFTGSSFPTSSLKRSYKYLKRGYSICDENIIAIAEAVAEEIQQAKESDDMESVIDGMDPDGGRRIRVID